MLRGSRGTDDTLIATDAQQPSDAEAMAWLDSLVRRLLICAGTLLLAFIVVALPIPFVTHISVTQFVLGLYLPPPSWPNLQYVRPGEGFWVYFQTAFVLAFVLDHAVLIYHLPAMLAPPRRSRPGRVGFA